MKDKIVLVSKDAMCRAYLPVYGNKMWAGKTPNIDELAAKGTVFTNAYTVAPSSAMSYLGMFTRKFPYELDIHDYTPIKEEFKDNVFNQAEQKGYSCHIIWDESWNRGARQFSNCYGNAVFNSLPEIVQPVGPHLKHEGYLVRDDSKLEKVYHQIEDEIRQLLSIDKLFLWIHMPQVINGRVAYGGDIDAFDVIVGIVRKYFDDSSIFVTSDHGNMNGTHGKIGYGYNVYDQAIRIPLIAPRIDDMPVIDSCFSTVDIAELMFTGNVRHRDFIYVDTEYYKQPHRKLAIIAGKYKYIYNKETNTEEAYDLEYDPTEGIDLAHETNYYKERRITVLLREMIPYTNWDELQAFIESARKEKEKIWKQETFAEHVYWKVRHWGGDMVAKVPFVERAFWKIKRWSVALMSRFHRG